MSILVSMVRIPAEALQRLLHTKLKRMIVKLQNLCNPPVSQITIEY
jgi:hypothetical protein